MDSDAVTKANDAEKSESVENSKDNVPSAAVAKTCEEKVVDEIDNQGEKTSDEKDNDSTATVTEKESEEEVVEEVEGKVQEDNDTESKTTTTVVVTKKDADDQNAKTETTTTTTVVVTKKDTDDQNAKTETTTTTSVVLTKSDESPQTEVDSRNTKASSENHKNEETKETLTLKGSDTANNKDAEQVSEESEDPSEDEEDDNEEEETEKAEEVKDSEPNPSVPTNVKQTEEIVEEKVITSKRDINNQIENIISDIDINIKAQEKITQLKEQELALIQKQKELANQIHQQQLLAQKLIAENQLKEQELKSQQIQQQQQQQQQLDFQNRNQYKEKESTPKVSDAYNEQQDDFYNIKESSNVSRTVDLRKIFTPATDAPQILPKNRKLYASSAFYSPSLHPTVEDQVELARRISHSLSDISNQTSKGQTMYVNRKKRSVKWVHEGSAQGEDDTSETNSLYKENAEANLSQELTKLEKMPLKLIMNPRGQMRDYNSLKESINIETGLLSPDNCAELITALQLHKGRGAELFAKRRRKADNWVVDETNAGTESPSGIPDYQQYQAKPATSPSILPAYSDAGKHRVQLNLHQDQLIEKYSKPGVQVIKSPWEAALQTGSASSAFVQDQKYGTQTPIASVASPVHFNQDVNDFSGSGSGLAQTQSRPSAAAPSSNVAQDSFKNNFDTRFQAPPIQPCNPQRELAYKPSVAQGWGGRNVELPREHYHGEFDNYNADDMSCCYRDPNDNNIVMHQNTIQGNTDLTDQPTNYFTKSQSLVDFNDEVQQRLQQLEHFQQRLAFGLGLTLANKQMPIPLTMPPGQRAMSTDSLNSSVNCHSHKQTSMNRTRLDWERNPKTTKKSTSQNIESESESENIDSVNVRELIHSFEKQSLRDQDEHKNCKSNLAKTAEERLIANDSKIEQLTVPDGVVNQTAPAAAAKGLYVPKEISLASYAPPPAQARDQQFAHNYGPGPAKIDFAKDSYASGAGEVSNAFPVSNTTCGSGFYSSPQAPKQQLYAPQSYQKVPTSSMQAAPQVNFNPSPLSFEKLSKFQDQGFDQRNTGAGNQRYLNITKQQPGYNGVRNVTPTPFGSAEIENRSTYDNLQRSPISPIPKQFGGYQQSTKSCTGQSFNNCARGWNNGSGAQRNVFCPRGQAAAPSNSLPYSDF